MAIEYPPYVSAYGGIPKLFAKIKEAAVPPKFTLDFLNTVLGLKSSSYRAMIPLLKKLGFVDPANLPTQAYRDVRETGLAGKVMADQLRAAYKPLFNANEYIYKLDKKALMEKLRSVLGASEDDANIPNVASTFIELAKMARWEGADDSKKIPLAEQEQPGNASGGENGERGGPKDFQRGRLGLSYTINLNFQQLPRLKYSMQSSKASERTY
jgi:hypothetical protein